MQFHRQLIAAGDIHEKTLEVLFEVKEHIKRLEEKNKRFKSDVQPQLAKKESAGEVEVPKNYGSGLSPPNRRSMLVVLYQHFLFNIKEQQKEQGVEEFVLGVEKNLFEVSRGDLNIYNREVKKICQHFHADSCRTAKLRMLRGEISAKDVALNKSEAFMSDESLQKYQENIKQGDHIHQRRLLQGAPQEDPRGVLRRVQVLPEEECLLREHEADARGGRAHDQVHAVFQV